MRVLRIILVILSFVLVGCSTSPATLSLIERSEQLAIDHPDSALNIIRSVDPSTIYGRDDRARYTLALCEAYYYNRQDAACDSLVQQLFDYYLTSDRHHERARALYQYGYNSSQHLRFSDAVLSLIEAERSLQYVDNPRLCGLVYLTFGEIYGETCLFKEAIESYEKALHYFAEEELHDHCGYAFMHMVACCNRKRDYHKVIELANQAEREFLSDVYYGYNCEIAIEKCFAYIQLGDIASCEEYFATLNFDYAFEESIAHYYCVDTILKAAKDDFEGAEQSLMRAKEYNPAQKMYTVFAEYYLLKEQGRAEEALSAYVTMSNRQGNAFLSLINNSVLCDQINYLEDDILKIQALHRRSNLIVCLVFAIVFIVALFVIYYLHTRAVAQRTRVSMLVDQIESAKQDISLKNSRIKTLSEAKSNRDVALSAMQRRFNENIGNSLRNIDELLASYYSNSTKRVHREQIIEALDKYVAEFGSSPNGYLAVEEYVNQYRDNIMTKLRAELPTLAEVDIRLLCLTYADFSTNAICMFLEYDRNKLYKRKSRLKTIIRDSQAKSKDLFLKYIG